MRKLTISSSITNRDSESFRRYLKEVSDIKLLTTEEEQYYTALAASGDKKAIDELIRRNLRFVISVAKKYENSTNNLEDLINEGNIGLITAANRFKPDMGVKFISYAVWWIRKTIMEHLSKDGKMVRLPANKINGISKLEKRVALLEQRLGRPADIVEIMEDLGPDADIEEISILEELSMSQVDSLDKFLFDGNDTSQTTLADMLVDAEQPDTDHLLVENTIKNEIKSMLDSLKPRDRYVISCIYGLDGHNPTSMYELSKELNVSREMVRQIKEKTLAQIRVKFKKFAVEN